MAAKSAKSLHKADAGPRNNQSGALVPLLRPLGSEPKHAGHDQRGPDRVAPRRGRARAPRRVLLTGVIGLQPASNAPLNAEMRAKPPRRLCFLEFPPLRRLRR
jgi:hypothetical protein